MSDIAIDRLINRRWAAPAADQPVHEVRYLRAGGDLLNDGTSPADAWPDTAAGLERGLRWMAMAAVNTSSVLDITGCDIQADSLLQLGSIMTGGTNYGLDSTATGPNNFYSRATCQIRSELSLVLAVDLDESAQDPTTDLWTNVVVQGGGLTPGAHVGQFLCGEGLLECAVIVDNDANSLFITTTDDPTGWTGQVGIYATGASLTFGDPLDFFNGAVQLLALSDWSFSGITIASTDASKSQAIQVTAVCPVYFLLCDLTGIQVIGGPDTVFMDYSYVHDAFVVQDGGAMSVRHTFVSNCTVNLHGGGKGSLNNLVQSVFDGLLTPWGNNDDDSEYRFQASNCQFSNGAADGIAISYGANALTNCLVDGNAGDGILVQYGATVVMTNVDGNNGGDFGVNIQTMGQVVDGGGNSVDATDDIGLGDAGAFTWADLPEVDLGQLCRAG